MIYTALQRSDHSSSYPSNLSVFWNPVFSQDDADGTTRALSDELGNLTGGNLVVVSIPWGGFSGIVSTSDGDTFGDAAWVDEAVIVNNAISLRSDPSIIRYTGFVPNDTYYVEVFGTHNAGSGRDVFISVNGSTPLEYIVEGNLSETATVETTADANGELSVSLTGTGFQAYAQALRIYDATEVPVVVRLDQEPVYGATISGTYSNFSGVPATSNTITVSDGTRSISVPVTVTDNANGTGSFTGTMPALPAAGSSLAAGSLVFPGSISITLTDPGA